MFKNNNSSSRKKALSSDFIFNYLFAFIFLAFPLIIFASTNKNTLLDIKSHLLKGARLEIILTFKEKPTQFNGFMMNAPTQFVFDLPNTQNNLKKPSKEISASFLKSYQTVSNLAKTRIVFMLSQQANYSVRAQDHCLFITFSPVTIPLETQEHKVYRPNQLGNLSGFINQIKSVDFKRAANGGGDFIINLNHPNSQVDIKSQNNQLILNFFNTRISSFWERKLDVNDFGTPVKNISIVARGTTVTMIMIMSGPYHQMNYESKKGFIVNIVGTSQNQANYQQAKTYKGKRLTLNFQNIGVRNALQLLAQFANINIVVSDSVTGNMTLNVKNIPWDEAMDIIMRTRGLGQTQMGDVYLIAPEEEIANQERQQLAAKQQISNLEPLHSELIQINYGKASEIAALLKGQGTSLLSSRGNVSVDNRTNTLWILDTPTKLSEIKQLVEKLDIPVKQVLIETRIVNVDASFTQELGIRWGVTSPNHLSGSLDGANKMTQLIDPSAVPIDERLNVDLPVQTTGAASIGLALYKIANNTFLDLELSALESEGNGKIIASPKLITANQKEATIESGEEIPYQQATSSGATAVAFKKAVLGLKVTPQITPDNRIVLTLKINQDKRGAKEFQGVPTIDTRAIETQVLVDNGQTVVLGGIFQRTKNNQIQRVPFLGAIPVIGDLFRYKKEDTVQQELLIFVTPKIIKQATYANQS